MRHTPPQRRKGYAEKQTMRHGNGRTTIVHRVMRLLLGFALMTALGGWGNGELRAQVPIPEGTLNQPRGFAARAQDSSVLAATSTPVLNFWYGKEITFRSQGVPQRWANILGNVSDPDGIASLTYSLNAGPQVDLSIGPDTRRLLNPGDFNIDLSWAALAPLPDTNRVVVTAIDSLSNLERDTVRVLYWSGTSWPLPYTVAWSTSSSLADSAQVVDGTWTRDGNGLRPVAIGYDRLVAVGDTTWTDYEVMVPITMHSIDASGYTPTSGRPVVGLLLRWIGHTDRPLSVAGWQPKSGWEPSGALGMYAFNAAPTGERLEIWKHKYDSSGKTLQMGQPYVFKMRAQNQAGGIFYGLRVWTLGEPEPAVWDLTWLDTAREAPRGSIVLLAHHVDATFGAVTIVRDTLALPVELASFTAQAISGVGVELAWRTMSEVNNYGFEVEKSPDTPKDFERIAGGFVPGSGTTLTPREYSFTDYGATPGLWYYRLRQIDLDGTVTLHEPIRVTVDATTTAEGSTAPLRFGLDQNYPNPFNPSTTIEFHLGRRGRVALILYDMLGRELERLVDGERPAGTHRVVVDGSRLAAGTYVYRLVAGDFVASHRMVLVK